MATKDLRRTHGVVVDAARYVTRAPGDEARRRLLERTRELADEFLRPSTVGATAFSLRPAPVRDGIAADIPAFCPPPPCPEPYQSLKEALDAGDEAALDALLAEGVDLNGFADRFGTTPLFWAMMAPGRSARVIDKLLSHGADATHATGEGDSVLHEIGDYRWGEERVAELSRIVALLVAHGADLEARTSWGWTPLYHAVFAGSAIEVAALLLNGADANAAPAEAEGPDYAAPREMLLAAGDQTEKVRMLLAHGADPRPVLARFAAEAAEAESLVDAQHEPGVPAGCDAEEGYAASLALLRDAAARWT